MKAFFEAIARGVRWLGKLVLFLLGWATILVFVVISLPTSYFLWRANQPMTMAEYNGLSYNEFTEWRMMICEQNLEKSGAKECPPSIVVVGFDAVVTVIPFVIALKDYPELLAAIPPAEFLPGVWDWFESNTWLANDYALHKAGLQVPTPEQFAEMQVK